MAANERDQAGDYETLSARIIGELARALRTVEPGAVGALVAQIGEARRVFVAGKGRSGLQMRGFAMRLMHLGLTAHVVDDVTTPGIAASDLLIIGSGSGKTPSLVGYAEKAKKLDAQLALITTAKTSPIGALADLTLWIDAPTPNREGSDAAASLIPMGGLFEMTLNALLEVVIVQLMTAQGVSGDEMYARHANLE